jgi:heme/copper-type cytochrome/quinol oxidase subunit 4
VAKDVRHSTNMSKIGVELAKFAFFAALTVLAAWVAATGRVAYMFTMLVIAAALAYAILDLVDYEIVKRKRRG